MNKTLYSFLFILCLNLLLISYLFMDRNGDWWVYGIFIANYSLFALLRSKSQKVKA